MKAFLKILVVEILGLHNSVEPIPQFICTRNSNNVQDTFYAPDE